MDRARTLGLAAELAFWLFFALIPLVAVVGMLAAKLAVGNAPLLGQLLAAVPYQTRDLVRDQLASVAAWNGGAVGMKAALVFIWMASSGVHAVFELLEIKSGARRSWIQRRLLSLLTCLGLSVALPLLALLATGLGWIEALLQGALPHVSWFENSGLFSKLLRLAAGFAAAVGLASGLYWVGIPRRRRKQMRMRLLPGAILAVATHFLLGAIYVLYLGKMGVGSAYQAGLSVIIVTLVALYIFSLALLMGAQLNCTLASRPPKDEGESNGENKATSRSQSFTIEQEVSPFETGENRPLRAVTMWLREALGSRGE